MEYLLAYDIVKDDLRKEVAEICLNKGMTRIQYSVFFGNVSRNIIETILMEIKEISKGEQLELIICQMCEKCSKKKIIYISEEKSGKKRSVKENGIEDENDENEKEEREKKDEKVKKKSVKEKIEQIKEIAERGVIIL